MFPFPESFLSHLRFTYEVAPDFLLLLDGEIFFIYEFFKRCHRYNIRNRNEKSTEIFNRERTNWLSTKASKGRNTRLSLKILIFLA